MITLKRLLVCVGLIMGTEYTQAALPHMRTTLQVVQQRTAPKLSRTISFLTEKKINEAVGSTTSAPLAYSETMERKLAGNMEQIVYNILASLKKAQVEAASVEAEYIANLAGFELSKKINCGEMTKSFPKIEPATSPLAFDFNASYPDTCISLVQGKKIDTIKDLTEKVVNCPKCMETFLSYTSSLRKFATKK